jgi:hypothetical protein
VVPRSNEFRVPYFDLASWFSRKRQDFQIPAFRYVAVLMGLFALYYTRELDRYGNALLGEEKKANATVQ